MITSGKANGKAISPNPSTLPDGPMARRMMVGAKLRRLREARGITRHDAGNAIRASHSKISRLELGRTGFKQRDVADLLTLYGVNDESERAHWLALAKETNTSGWWREYADLLPAGFEHYLGLEQVAGLVRRYEVQFIPDLLQTADYARAVIRHAHADEPGGQHVRRIKLQARRQQILRRPEPTRLWAVIDEAALRRQLGGAATMRHQLEHLIRLAALPHVTIQVMPFRAGHAAAGGPITMLRFTEGELSDVVYLEQLTSALCLEKGTDVIQYRHVLDRLSVQAETPAATTAILRTILEKLRS